MVDPPLESKDKRDEPFVMKREEKEKGPSALHPGYPLNDNTSVWVRFIQKLGLLSVCDAAGTDAVPTITGCLGRNQLPVLLECYRGGNIVADDAP